jgi:two-component system C4-dicarboxylate transport sensor histidine kinase DctB
MLIKNQILVDDKKDQKSRDLQIRTSLLVRLFIVLFITFGILLIIITNFVLTSRFSQETTKQAELRLKLYSNSIDSELERSRFITLLLGDNVRLKTLLSKNQNKTVLNKYFNAITNTYSQNITLYDATGKILSSSEKALSSQILSQIPFSVSDNKKLIFSRIISPEAKNKFVYAKLITHSEMTLGIILVEVNLSKIEKAWIDASEAVIVIDHLDQVLISSKPDWIKTKINDKSQPSQSSNILNSMQSFTQWEDLPAEAYLNKNTLLKLESNLSEQNWKILYYSTYATVREKVNGIIALEITALAILLTLIFYLLSRRSRIQSIIFMEESNKLRDINSKLKNEMNEREKAEKNLKVAEQSLEQHSKLAALGEMSAAVSHELNQPLAAMKTYLAGAKLLLQRDRPNEALSSFQRVDDLIERMNVITKQLKSYARKGREELVQVDLKMVISYALDIMASQLNLLQVEYLQQMPDEPVMVLGDQIRLEQVVINLIRNSLDAMAKTNNPKLKIILKTNNNAVITVIDNGHGISDLKSLFEPFYTTKDPGHGVGLGLAISSGIIKELGGRLVAKNSPDSGAIFEITLPLIDSE